MAKIAATPKARILAKERGLNLESIAGSGEYGAIFVRDLPARANRERRSASPVAKKMAAYYGVDISLLDKPFVRKADIEAITATAKITPISSKRKALAEGIEKSLSSAAPFTVFTSLDATEFMAAAKTLKDDAQQHGIHVTVTDLLIYLISGILPKHPKLNSSLIGGQIYSYNYVNLSLAVSCEDGLLAPVINGAGLLGVMDIAKERERLVKAVRCRNLTADALTGGTFTLSNLGATPVTHFTPILNYPQSAILGVGRTERVPVVREDDTIGIGSVMHFSLTADHYLTDGKDAADFFSSLAQALKKECSDYKLQGTQTNHG